MSPENYRDVMRELKSDQPTTLPQRLIRAALGALCRVVPQRKPHVDVPHPPDLALETALREHLPFLFGDWEARILQSQSGTVVIECGSFVLKAIRERDFLVFFVAPTTKPHSWENADIAIAAATGEPPLDIRTSLTYLAEALKPRVAALQSAFSSEHISRTEEVIATLRRAADERSRSSFSR